MRLEGKVAVIIALVKVPARASAMVARRQSGLREGQGFDRFIASAEETAAMAAQEGGECEPFAAYVTREATLAAG